MRFLPLLTLLCSGLALASDVDLAAREPKKGGGGGGGGVRPPVRPPPGGSQSKPDPTTSAAATTSVAVSTTAAATTSVVSTTEKPSSTESAPSSSTGGASTTSKPSTTTGKTSTTKTSTTTGTTTAGAACAYCGEFDKKKSVRDEGYSDMFDRAANGAPVCIPPAKEDRPTEKRDTSDSLFGSLFSRFTSSLGVRALTDKESKVETALGKAGSYKFICSVGKYAPSGDAVSIAKITKYWRFKAPSNPQGCSMEVEQVSTGNKDDYETDHVFEAQTLANFMKWLADEAPGKIGTTYDKPSALWVEETLIEKNTAFRIKKQGKTNPGSLHTPTPDGEIPVVLMAYGYGRSDGVKGIEGGQNVERIPADRGNSNLVLLDKDINGPKGIYFKKNKPDSDFKLHTTQLQTRIRVRRGVGPFQYLAADDGTTDTMWKKWARVSNWIDLVCHTFDQQYQWGTHAGEPKNSAGTPSLRSLYAHFIDKELDDIEAKAALWAGEAKKSFDAKWKNLTPAEKQWRDEAFGTNGFATAGELKFPRPANLPTGASKYGAYGWSDVTFDARNQDPNIGSPIKIT